MAASPAASGWRSPSPLPQLRDRPPTDSSIHQSLPRVRPDGRIVAAGWGRTTEATLSRGGTVRAERQTSCGNLTHFAASPPQRDTMTVTDTFKINIPQLSPKCSRVFHNGGGRVVLCGNDWEKLEALQQALIDVADPSCTFSPKLMLLDLSETENVPEVAKEILESYGCVDVLINNSSLKVKGGALNVTLEMDKKIMDANYFGPISLTKELLPSMISRHCGQIVLVNSIQGKLGLPFRAAYAASKHAMQAFFDCLRAEVAEFGITVSTVSPTFIRSYHQMPDAGNWEASIWKFFFRKWAYGVHPVEVAEEVLYTVNRGSKECDFQNHRIVTVWKDQG
ncbi:dehydrogenase/reductase SDR family member 7C [Rhincodon typus]|uniref:dehydrogenase/reductase SDR family member 7C n=1 Tax=Rhincodon typus TaxID=259920 RepID=UPI0020305C43|nr:dehydrogenase/reductase SDR family member 7C [Rhincodon typus]